VSELFLIWHGDPKTAVELAEPMHALRDDLILVRSDRTLSRLYHAVKHQLPRDTALCVAPLASAPKFKGMTAGALTWVRRGA